MTVIFSFCVRTAGDELGMIEVVLNSNTLAGIVAESASADGGKGWSRKLSAAMKVFSKDHVYKEWLLAQGVCSRTRIAHSNVAPLPVACNEDMACVTLSVVVLAGC